MLKELIGKKITLSRTNGSIVIGEVRNAEDTWISIQCDGTGLLTLSAYIALKEAMQLTRLI